MLNECRQKYLYNPQWWITIVHIISSFFLFISMPHFPCTMVRPGAPERFIGPNMASSSSHRSENFLRPSSKVLVVEAGNKTCTNIYWKSNKVLIHVGFPQKPNHSKLTRLSTEYTLIWSPPHKTNGRLDKNMSPHHEVGTWLCSSDSEAIEPGHVKRACPIPMFGAKTGRTWILSVSLCVDTVYGSNQVYIIFNSVVVYEIHTLMG